MEINCCDEPILIHDQPVPDDDQKMVHVVCGNCGHDYGTMPLTECEKLIAGNKL